MQSMRKARAAAASMSTSISPPASSSAFGTKPAANSLATGSDANPYQSVALEPEWREEVSRRLDAYRARHGRPMRDDSQSGLPFTFSARQTAEWDDTDVEEERAERERDRIRNLQKPVLRATQRAAAAKKARNECVEICIQPELDFSSSPGDRAHPQNAVVPVANLDERRTAGALDGMFLALTYAGFLALFRSLGGQLVMEKVDAVVYLAVFYLFYAQYFFLFTTFAGSTPGMQLRGLTVVRLDGSLPDSSQLLWRSFGYLLSGAAFMLGYIWALWDEDRFTWQDRISQTYITSAMPASEVDAFEVPVTRRTHYAHK
jgi:uncharacterized RDD family membrane protein YckC